MKKTALITGASRGIGEGIARLFAQKGFHLALCCRNSEDTLLELARELRSQYHITVLCYVGNVGDHCFVEGMVQDALSHLGSIDVLVNNAGIAHIGLLSDMTISEWNELVSVNLTSVFSACKCVIPSMVRRQSGKIINISSVWGTVGASCEAAYSACKGGIHALTRALGKELAPSNIQVNAIACGMIDTSMNACFDEAECAAIVEEIPAGRMGTTRDVAELVLSLAEGHPYLTGQILTLDGGWQ